MDCNYELYHWGVKGMKWGVRRKQRKLDKLKDTHEDYRTAHTPKSVSSMSNKELRERNNRLQMEKQYRDLTKKTSKGEKVVKGIIATATTIAALETAYKTYTRVGGSIKSSPVANKVIDKIGDVVVNSFHKRGF